MVTRSEFDLLFSQICGKYGFDLDLSEDMLAKFYIISENLLSENEKFNLTAIRTLDGVILKHICDSACVANHIPTFPSVHFSAIRLPFSLCIFVASLRLPVFVPFLGKESYSGIYLLLF